MIKQISGKISHIGDKFIVIDVLGIGFKVFVSSDTLFEMENKTEQEIKLWTYLSVKEDSLDLYGFLKQDDLDFFEKIISVSGIGPKKGIAIMGVAPAKTLKKAIAEKDLSYLTQVSGIGRKNAEKIVLELRDKIGDISEEGTSLKDSSDVMLAIKSLGYGSSETREAMKNIPTNIKGVSEKIKWVLKELGK